MRIKFRSIYTDIMLVGIVMIMTLLILQTESCSIYCWLGFKKIFFNLLIEMIVWMIFFLFSGNLKFCCIVTLTLNVLVGFINAQVIMFRGNEITINDINAINTALSVAGGYKITLNVRLWIAIVLYLVTVIFILKVKFFHNQYGRKRVGITLVSVGVIILSVYRAASRYTPFIWKEEGGLYNGILLEWMIELTNSKIVPPEGYSAESVGETINRYKNMSLQEDKAYKTPNIIVIMSESYADLDILGDIETNKEYSAYFDEIYKNSVHGYAVASIYGGTTANSEWEFLTGSTMMFLPQGAIPYQQYMNSEANSLVKALKNQGYDTISIHPYKPGGWARDTVYPHLGFDSSLWDSDFQAPKYIREYISDESFYEKIIDIFENKGKNPLFVFGVSMQNHGGYDQMNQREVSVENMNRNYEDVDEYLSLLSISDEALKGLIAYFQNCKEEVVILFFGDHQPYLNEEFYMELGSDFLAQYVIPFFIWNNEKNVEVKELELTSINYLSSIMLEEAGMVMPGYNQALLKIREQIPVVCALGYLNVHGEWNSEYDLAADSALNDLWMLQYINDMDAKIFSKYRSFFCLDEGRDMQ